MTKEHRDGEKEKSEQPQDREEGKEQDPAKNEALGLYELEHPEWERREKGAPKTEDT